MTPIVNQRLTQAPPPPRRLTQPPAPPFTQVPPGCEAALIHPPPPPPRPYLFLVVAPLRAWMPFHFRLVYFLLT